MGHVITYSGSSLSNTGGGQVSRGNCGLTRASSARPHSHLNFFGRKFRLRSYQKMSCGWRFSAWLIRTSFVFFTLDRKYLRDNERNYLARKVRNIPVHCTGLKISYAFVSYLLVKFLYLEFALQAFEYSLDIMKARVSKQDPKVRGVD